MAVSSTPAQTPVAVCSRALILVGAEPITSFDDGNNEALIASNMYEDVARASLLNTRWRFSTNQAVLNRLSDAPTGRFDAAYQLPSGWLMTHVVTVNDTPIEYQTYGDKLFCNETATSELVLDFTYRADEQGWPSYFTIAVEYELASVFAVSLARDQNLAQAMSQQAATSMMRARNLDAQQQTTRKLSTSRFITNRRT
jgi:hypothetical protein|tara:strand:- start:3009 stop:3602 length:594 start_codon:yes stop_codon:yes gene_type:complete